MKKWKGSIAGKITAWILISVCALCFAASAAGMLLMLSTDIYGNTIEKTREEWFLDVTARYSLVALDGLAQGTNSETFADKAFRYGIIQAESLDGIDLNDDSSYLERNFTEHVEREDLQVYSQTLSEQDWITYGGDFLTGYANVIQGEGDWRSLYADGICYDTAQGIFYYSAEGQYYPVQTVEIETENGTLSCFYDFEEKMYTNSTWTEVARTEAVDAAGESYEAPAVEGASDESITATETTTGDNAEQRTVEEILQEPYITLSMFDGTNLAYENWGTLWLDNVRSIDMPQVKLIDSTAMEPEEFTELTDYYLDDNYTLWVNEGDSGSQRTTYYVVSLLPERVGTGWGSADLFVQANTWLTFCYSMRYPVFAIIFVSFALGLAAFVYLMSAAGHRSGTDEIVPLAVDKIPLDIYAVMIGAAEILLFIGLLWLTDTALSRGSVAPVLIICAGLALCMGWLLLLFLLGFSVRVKLGKWWRNTVCWRIFKAVRNFCGMVWSNIGFLWKIILVLGVLAVLEFFGLVAFVNDGWAVLLWFVEKLILYPVILWISVQMYYLKEGTEKIAGGEADHKINTKWMRGEFRRHGENINNIGEGMNRAVEERMKSERFKTELITNVSHDIKTPLTSIINYVDLLEKEDLQNETACEYLEVLKRQSDRLKKLIEDLIEASKASTGNLPVHLERLEAGIFLVQTVGEFEEKTQAAGLELMISQPKQPVYIMADSRHFWRVIDNLMNNICKYAQSGTRVYINLEVKEAQVEITFRNTSRYPLNISSEELMERFVRGDSSRNTEGSGLGLSIAGSLMDLMGGSFRLYVDGDLFKVVLGFEEACED